MVSIWLGASLITGISWVFATKKPRKKYVYLIEMKTLIVLDNLFTHAELKLLNKKDLRYEQSLFNGVNRF